MRNSLETNHLETVNIIQISFYGGIVWYVENPFLNSNIQGKLIDVLSNTYDCKVKMYNSNVITNCGKKFINTNSYSSFNNYTKVKPFIALFNKTIVEDMRADIFQELGEEIFNYINKDLNIEKSYNEVLNNITNNTIIENIIN